MQSICSKEITRADTKSISDFCQKIEKALAKHDIKKSHIFNIVLSVDEILTNILRHGKTKNTNRDKHIEIILIKQKNRITVSIKDNCEPYAIGKISKINIHEYMRSDKIGGFGLIIVNELADSYSMQRIGNTNIITLTKII